MSAQAARQSKIAAPLSYAPQGLWQKGVTRARTPAAAGRVGLALRALDAVQGPGLPLSAEMRHEAALRYGYSFADVRVHTDAPASTAAAALRASAFTLGNHIAFGSGRYAPSTLHGQLLLQHELRHVAQQRSAAPVSSPEIDLPHSRYEREARQILDPRVDALSVQRVQCAPEDEQFSLGDGFVDTVGKSAFGDRAWPFIKAVFEGFVGGVQADVKSGRAESAKSHLSTLLVPWNAVKFYGGYLVGLVLGLISPVTDLVKGAIGLVRLGISALEWLAKWSPAGVAISPERQRKIARVVQKFSELTTEFGKALGEFAADPKGAIKKFSGFLDNLMQMALGKAREIGAKGAHSIFDFLESDYYEMGKGIGEVIGTLIAQVLLLVFSDAIGNLISKGASFLGKAAEFVAGKAVEVFEWVKGIVSEVVALLRDAVKSALKLFEGLVNKTVEAFDALKALFSEAASIELGGEKVAAGVGRGVSGPAPNVMESRMVSSVRTSPARVSDLTPPKVHPSNVPAEAPAPTSPLADEAKGATKREPFADDPEFHESIKELEDVPGAEKESFENLQEKNQSMQERKAQAAGLYNIDKHHVFPQEMRPWFERRGMKGADDIDNFTVQLDKAMHQAEHGGGDWKLARANWENEYNTLVSRELKAAEAAKRQALGSRKALLTPSEIKATVFRIMDERGIPREFVKYTQKGSGP